jgi:hypothetical protein
MTKFKLTDDPAGLTIRIEDLGEKQPQLLQALQECAEGRCRCPTSQYERLQKIEIAPLDGVVQITLTPKEGESIDRAAIDRCLEYTADKLSGSQQ